MELSYRIHKTTDFIFEYLTDMQKFVSVHPVIFQIDKTGNDSYLIHETLKLGWIPFSFTYPATIEKRISDNVVVIRATVFRLTKIKMTFVLTADNDHTMIGETIDFISPLPVTGIMQRIFKKQHNQLFKNIEQK